MRPQLSASKIKSCFHRNVLKNIRRKGALYISIKRKGSYHKVFVRIKKAVELLLEIHLYLFRTLFT